MLACIFTPMKVHRSDGMNPVDIIVKKRDGHELSRQEIEFFHPGADGRPHSRLPGGGLGNGDLLPRHDRPRNN